MRWTSIIFSACAVWALFCVAFSSKAEAWYLSGRIGYTMPEEDDAGLLEDLDLKNSASGAFACGGELEGRMGVEKPCYAARQDDLMELDELTGEIIEHLYTDYVQP